MEKGKERSKGTEERESQGQGGGDRQGECGEEQYSQPADEETDFIPVSNC